THMIQDSERLPEGFQRVGYDADTQTYTFVDAEGRTYESAEGNRYGVLRPVGPNRDTNPARTFDDIESHNTAIAAGNKEAVRTMLPFALLVLVVLLLIFRFLYSGSGSGDAASGSGSGADDASHSQVHCAQGYRALQVEEGQSCWEIAQGCGLGVEEFLGIRGNERVECQRLGVGSWVCVPE
ncbi:carbohydrate-binding module family 50 protein, partial [Lophiostoma macrostomum CBS 122681]